MTDRLSPGSTANRTKSTAPEILFVTRKWSPAIGGMETFCLRLTEALSRLEPVEVVALSGGRDGLPPNAIALLTFPFTVVWRYLRRRSPPRVLHLGDMAIWPLALPALLWRETRIFLSAHGTDVSYHRRGGLKGRMYGGYQKLGSSLLRKALVVANSRTTSDAAAELGWMNPSVVPLATDLVALNVRSSHDGEILFAGRLVERKGCAWFAREVVPLIPEKVRLNVAGTTWNAAEAEILGHPRINFLGGLPQGRLAQRYAHAMCVIVPNIEPGNGEFEGFGLVACEAAACGGVVLAARSGGLVEAVIDGITGFLLPAGDAEAWASKIMEIANWSDVERRAFTTQATLVARQRYSWSRVADDYLTLYDQNR